MQGMIIFQTEYKSDTLEWDESVACACLQQEERDHSPTHELHHNINELHHNTNPKP